MGCPHYNKLCPVKDCEIFQSPKSCEVLAEYIKEDMANKKGDPRDFESLPE